MQSRFKSYTPINNWMEDQYRECKWARKANNHLSAPVLNESTTSISVSTIAKEIKVPVKAPEEPRLDKSAEPTHPEDVDNKDVKHILTLPEPHIFIPTLAESLVNAFELRLVDRELPSTIPIMSLVYSIHNILSSIPLLENFAKHTDMAKDQIDKIFKRRYEPLNAWIMNPPDVNGKVKDVRKLQNQYSKMLQEQLVYRYYNVFEPEDRKSVV